METKNFKFRETDLPQKFKLMAEEKIFTVEDNGEKQGYTFSLEVDDNHCCDSTDIFGTLFVAIASLMCKDQFKPTDGKAALVFNDDTTEGAGRMLMACISEFVKEENDGNWYFSFSFNPNDIKNIKDENIYSFYNLEKIMPFAAAFNNAFIEMHHKMIEQRSIINMLATIIIKCLINWLDSNAKEDTIVELIIDDVLHYAKNRTDDEYDAAIIDCATLSVTVDKKDGIKVMSGQFGEELKAIAKGNGDSSFIN